MGTKYAVEHFVNADTWDGQTRSFAFSLPPGKVDVVEFDGEDENESGSAAGSPCSRLLEVDQSERRHPLIKELARVNLHGLEETRSAYLVP